MFNLVIPTDFSQENRETVFSFLDIFFQHLPKGDVTKLTLLNAYDTPRVGQSIIYNMDEKLSEISEEDLEKEANFVKERFGNVSDYQIEKCSQKGSLLNVLHLYDKKDEIDFVILSYKADNFFDKIFRNSELNPSNIVNSLKEPVLFLPKGQTPKDIKTILFGVDLKPFDNDKDFELFLKFAEFFGAEIKFIHINTGAEGMNEQLFHDTFDSKLSSFRGEYSYVEIQSPRVIDGYLEFTKENNPDMVVLIEREDNFLKSFLGDSFADNFSKSFTSPLLVLSEKYDNE